MLYFSSALLPETLEWIVGFLLSHNRESKKPFFKCEESELRRRIVGFNGIVQVNDVLAHRSLGCGNR